MIELQNTEYGSVPANWRALTLEDISEKITDGAHLSPKPQKIGKYMCSVKDMTYNKFNLQGSKLISSEDYEKLVKQGCQPKKGDILISKDGANCLDLIFIFNQDIDVVLLSSIAIVRLLPDFLPEYVRYFLLSPDCQYTMRNNFVSGSAIPRVVLKDFRKVPILAPSLAEQKSIASILTSLDDKIDLLHRQNKTLEAMAETLFRQWFVEGAGDGKKSKLGEFVTVTDNRGKTPPYQEVPTDYPLIEVNALTDKCRLINYSAIRKYVTQETYKSWFRGHPEKYDLLMATVGSIGEIGMYLIKRGTIAQNVIGLKAKNISPIYLYEFLKNEKESIKELDIGSVQPSIKVPHLLSIEIFVPSKERQQEFHNHVENYLEKMILNYRQIELLEKLRDSLLSKLMSGEVGVK